MAKVYPQALSSSSSSSSFSSSSSSTYVSSKQECFTIWMKSLVYNSHGCTAYNSKGEIVNYEFLGVGMDTIGISQRNKDGFALQINVE
ncbi:LURP-one-related 11-like protein [Tanacetum coccineum]